MAGGSRLRDSLLVTGQTFLSNGFGASVGLEAAYAQIGGGLASLLGRWLSLRRGDLRTLVGAGAGRGDRRRLRRAADRRLLCLRDRDRRLYAGRDRAGRRRRAGRRAGHRPHASGTVPYLIAASSSAAIHSLDYLALRRARPRLRAWSASPLMRLVALLESARARHRRSAEHVRPSSAGCCSCRSPGPRRRRFRRAMARCTSTSRPRPPLGMLATIFLLKVLASAVSLGFGFRGGLFFASLFLGSLLGQIYAVALGRCSLSGRRCSTRATPPWSAWPRWRSRSSAGR